MNKNEFFSPIYCPKCKSVPLVQIHPKDNDVKILISCKCHQQIIKQDVFLKNYYRPNVKYKNIKESENIKFSQEKVSKYIKKLIINYQVNKEEFESKIFNIKEKLVKNLETVIKNIESIYKSNKDINNKIDKIIQILIKNYNSDPNNNTNIKNIILNTQLNLNNNLLNINYNDLKDFNKKIYNLFKDIYIIKANKYKPISSFTDTSPNKLILEIKDDIFATKYNNNFIKIFKLNKSDECFSFKIGEKINSLLIDKSKKYLISVNGNCFIKFWELNEIINKLKPNNDNKIMSLLPSYVYENENEILELINLDNNLLCGCDDKSIFTYNYNISQKSSEIIKKLNIKVENLSLIQTKNEVNKFIFCREKNYLCIIEAYQLELKNKIKIGKWENDIFLYEQINENEIIFGNNKNIKIFNLEKNKFSLSKFFNFNITCIKKLKDDIFLVGGKNEINFYSSKTLEEFPKMITFDNENYFDDDEEENDYSSGMFISLINSDRDVQSINIISKKRILIILRFHIIIYGFNFDEISKFDIFNGYCESVN